ncbi:MAG TPA: hypothetical protein VGR47_09770 [Terracidiphilus sp.]|nr:hypothetical protein [Terracidiphilus sp.]
MEKTKNRFVRVGVTARLFAASVFAVRLAATVHAAPIPVIVAKGASPRAQWGAQQLRAALASLKPSPEGARVIAALATAPELQRFNLPAFPPRTEEAFLIKQIGKTWVIAGSDASGVLYGELELADRIRATRKLPAGIDDSEHPDLKLRGVCIGMQKPEITYEGAEYDYRYTPQNFPFFYDKAGWIKYLDLLAENRYNTLYLWNGHPFTSLLKLPRYPEAQELPTAQLDQNIAMFQWITNEADKRGIWVLQGFYNIHLSHAFARAHHLPYHLSAPTPLATEYTRYVISQFVQHYPHAGLMMTLGEALAPRYGAEWISRAVIPGVKDGLKAVGDTTEPPIVVRAHATDIKAVMQAAMPLYSNIDTMAKWNGESLTWTDVRGGVRQNFEQLSKESNVTIANIHLLSDLEPFRWGDPDFIRETIANFKPIGIEGLHLYPLRYWDWPYVGDNTTPRLTQTQRDWIWFDAWGRYAWNPDRDPQNEHAYWVQQFADRFGTAQAGEKLLEAYTLAGPCQPTLLPRIGVTEGNRESLALGMTMPQMIDQNRFGPDYPLWNGDAPAGERLQDYVEKEVHHQPHEGQTPIGVSDQTVQWSTQALAAARAAAPFIPKDKAEYERIVNDMHSINLLMLYYNAKIKAAEQVLLYGYDHDASHLRSAEPLLSQSVDYFKQLTDFADPAYITATSMETSQRRIPFPGGMNNYPSWQQCLPMYEEELATFNKRVAQLASGAATHQAGSDQPFPQVDFTLKPGPGEEFTVEKGAQLFKGTGPRISDLDPQLAGLHGIRISPREGGALDFALAQPAQILLGYQSNGTGKSSILDPATEQWNLLLLNAISTPKIPGMAVWAKTLPAGPNEIDLGKGAYVVLGFIPANYHVTPHINFNATGNGPMNLDWLFE